MSGLTRSSQLGFIRFASEIIVIEVFISIN